MCGKCHGKWGLSGPSGRAEKETMRERGKKKKKQTSLSASSSSLGIWTCTKVV